MRHKHQLNFLKTPKKDPNDNKDDKDTKSSFSKTYGSGIQGNKAVPALEQVETTCLLSLP